MDSGATSWHKHAGLISGAIIEYPDNIATNIYDSNLWGMRSNVMVMHTIYGVTASACDCTNEAVWTSFVKPISNRAVIYSYCYEYCLFPEEQRLASDYNYDIKSDVGEEFELFLINGQHQPILEDMVVNRWRRIRLYNTMSQCMLYVVYCISCFVQK